MSLSRSVPRSPNTGSVAKTLAAATYQSATGLRSATELNRSLARRVSFSRSLEQPQPQPSPQSSNPVSIGRPLSAAASFPLAASLPVSIAANQRRTPHVVDSPSSGLLGQDDKFMPPHELLAQTLPQEVNYWGEPMTFKPVRFAAAEAANEPDPLIHRSICCMLPCSVSLPGRYLRCQLAQGSSVVEGRGSKLQGQAQIRFRAAIMRQTGFLENDADEAAELHAKLQKDRDAQAAC